MKLKTVAIGAVLLAAALVALAWPTRAEERVLYCTETASTGFFWAEGQTEGRASNFEPGRYIVKVLSEEKRTIKKAGDERGNTRAVTCRGAFGDRADPLVCDGKFGPDRWVFQGNNFVYAYTYGRPVGGDPNIYISYGTCTGF